MSPIFAAIAVVFLGLAVLLWIVLCTIERRFDKIEALIKEVANENIP